MIDSSSIVITKLEENVTIEPFDCGETDLNSFLSDDARNYYDDFMGVTYLVEYRKQLAAYYCLFMDKIVFDFSGKDDPKRKWWQVFNKKNKIHFNKQRKTYPALKIGRLAVDIGFKGCGIGSYILDAVITEMQGTRDFGCRFITVDAYSDAFGFYQKNDFEFLSSEDKADKTRLMYFDLKRMPNI
jgi:GNAT superfamily N-acetyltransferase